MKILPTCHLAIGADHRGFALKEQLKVTPIISERLITWHDCGADNPERSDYPVFARRLCKLVLENDAKDMAVAPTHGILLCGSGIGMSMAANRFRGIHAALAWRYDVAQRAREEDWANVLVLPADYLEFDGALQLVSAWLDAVPKAGCYRERIEAIDK
ncbi:MAG: RpiB/LacA/LacB family sugar-phosphate isomerase [Candidatus Dependentiae bacterium]|nr:RpiB/LacA/LacB family sugar-phosphate isomerase [Candidatus Dependentiae bacterium]